jgi:hypothetical protein
MKYSLLAMAVLLSACGVQQQYTAGTTASATRNGFQFDTHQNQSLKASGQMGADGSLSFEVQAEAVTPESAIAAAANANAAATKALTDVLSAILPIVQQAVQAGAASQGIPLPKGPINAKPAPSVVPAPAVSVAP